MQLSFPFPANRKDRFDNFVSDRRNEEAARLCKAFAEAAPGQPKSLVLHGPPGAGKTHLLAAMGSVVMERAGEGAALYLDCKTLAERVLSVKSYEELKLYLEKYENAAFLAVDNLDFVEGVSQAEDQIFHLYNAVVQGGGRFSAAVGAPPASWRFHDQLTTRLLWGQVLKLAPVGDDGMVSVLVKMAADTGLALPEKAAKWLITRLPRDPVSQREALERIDRYSLTMQRKISINLVKEALKEPDAR